MSDPTLTRTPKILTIPTELLLNIALQIDGKNCPSDVAANIKDWKTPTLTRNLSRSLKNMSLVCKQFQAIGQEAMVRKCAVHPENVWKLVGFFVRYPELAKKMTHLRLRTYDKGSGAFNPKEHFAACGTIILPSPVHPDSKLSKETQSLSNYLVTLLSLLSNVERLTSGTCACCALPPLRDMCSNSDFFWYSSSVQWFSERLKVLDIKDDFPQCRQNLGNLKLKHFKSLTHLSAPLASLSYTGMNDSLSLTSLKGALPSSLTWLNLYSPKFGFEENFGWLNQIFRDHGYFVELRQIQVFIAISLDEYLNFFAKLPTGYETQLVASLKAR